MKTVLEALNRLAIKRMKTYSISDIEENLRIALSLASGNSPATKAPRRLELIALHITRALKIINGKPL